MVPRYCLLLVAEVRLKGACLDNAANCMQRLHGCLQVNVHGGPYPAPFADIYRGMAIIGTKGFSALPKYCTTLMGAFFAAGGCTCAQWQAATC